MQLYFRLRYRDEINHYIEEDGRVVTALQLLPYPLHYLGRDLPTGYVSGACTHPAYQSRGLMRRLLCQTFQEMAKMNLPVSTLIPAEPWLFHYYAQSGYAPAFHYRTEIYSPDKDLTMPGHYTLHLSEEFRDAESRFLNRHWQEKPCSVLHTPQDLSVVAADLRLSKGHIYSLRRPDQTVAAVAVLYPDEPHPLIAEVQAADALAEKVLLNLIARQEQALGLTLLRPAEGEDDARPLGMLRLILPMPVLQQHAALHPDFRQTWKLTDEQLPQNNGYYRLADGRCTYTTQAPADSYAEVTPGQLAELLFRPLRPYMSLMMN